MLTEIVWQEDVDLLSFSNIDSMQHGRANSIIGDAGLPLKAVYRDCVVGFRYLHPLHVPQNQNPVSPQGKISEVSPLH